MPSMNQETKPQPEILEGEIIAPGAARERASEHGQARVHAVQMGWFGKTVAILAMFAIFAATIVLAAGALLILLPIAILGGLWTWWRIRKIKT